MQVIAPVTAAQLLDQAQVQPLLKLELYYACGWVDLTNLHGKNYVESVSFSVAGPLIKPEPSAGDWSATISNEGGIFHPDHPTSAPYNNYFKAGTKIRISLGGTYGGVRYLWRRFYGYMEEPSFSIDNAKISVKGFDLMQVLTNTKLNMPDNYWGSTAIFSTGDPGGTLGAEIYAENDAMEIGGGEANNVTGWTPTNCTFVSVADAGAGSVYVGKAFTTNINAVIKNINVGAALKSNEYRVQLDVKPVVGSPIGAIKVVISQTVGAVETTCASYTIQRIGDWTNHTFYFTALVTGPIIMAFTFITSDQTWLFDNISIKTYTSPTEYRYELPATATGIYYITLDIGYGPQISWFGARDQGKDFPTWWYNENTKQIFFDPGSRVEQGVDNLVVYYFTQQDPENVVADLLVKTDFYFNRAAALADMIYTPPGETIDRVWFEPQTTIMDAMRLICERFNYRFYFNYSGRPVFQPAAIAKTKGNQDFTFNHPHINDVDVHQERSEIFNRIIIEGEKQAQPVGIAQTMPSELKGLAESIASMHLYGIHTMTLGNHLFQDQTIIDLYAAEYLIDFKDPKWYVEFTTPWNPAPLAVGDTVRLQLRLSSMSGIGRLYDSFNFDSGVHYGDNGLIVVKWGLIRDVGISNYEVKYKCEVIDYDECD